MGAPASYFIEVWTEYGIGMCIFFLRFFARATVVGIRNFQYDDYFALLGMVLWTIDNSLIDVMGKHGSFVGLNEQTAAALDEKTVKSYTIGSKALFVAWITYVSMIWCMKAVLLGLYNRITLGLWQHRLIKIMAVSCGITYIAFLLTHFLHCLPIQKNWQVKPYAGDACTLTTPNYLVVVTTNVLTDLGILSIPLPLLWAVKIPIHRKLIIAMLLCSGIFVICAAILRAVFSVGNIGDLSNAALWVSRETFTSSIATSIPAIKPLFSKHSWINSSRGKSSSNKNSRGLTFPWSKSGGNTTATLTSRMGNGYELSNVGKGKTTLGMKPLSDQGSEEYIMGRVRDEVDRGEAINKKIEVQVTHEYPGEGKQDSAITSAESISSIGEEAKSNETGSRWR
ncbi:MAG: hypothetical protein M1834_001650 [Cirrosporium novae-zelandiae]|nr:MAG: hypothetical protein M1834_004167 [Cirrosporium novae-zelandiae]KAI9735634.1 MAG: hypothetical protein M1834_001650 [Cirrosporium novae-zelandiae]